MFRIYLLSSSFSTMLEWFSLFLKLHICYISLPFFFHALCSIETSSTLTSSVVHLQVTVAKFLPCWKIFMRTLHYSDLDISVWGGSRICPVCTFFLLYFFHLNVNLCLAVETGLLYSCPLEIRSVAEKSRSSFSHLINKFGSVDLYVKDCGCQWQTVTVWLSFFLHFYVK